MPQRKRLDREGLEFYLLNLLLRYRPLLRIDSVILLIYAVTILFFYPLGSLVGLLIAAFLLLMTFSYSETFHVAKFGAWLGTIRKDS